MWRAGAVEFRIITIASEKSQRKVKCMSVVVFMALLFPGKKIQIDFRLLLLQELNNPIFCFYAKTYEG